jgi:hypothetical protein
VAEVFTPENGLLTANGKLRRDVIDAHLQQEIAAMYDITKSTAVATAGQR